MKIRDLILLSEEMTDTFICYIDEDGRETRFTDEEGGMFDKTVDKFREALIMRKVGVDTDSSKLVYITNKMTCESPLSVYSFRKMVETAIAYHQTKDEDMKEKLEQKFIKIVEAHTVKL